MDDRWREADGRIWDDEDGVEERERGRKKPRGVALRFFGCGGSSFSVPAVIGWSHPLSFAFLGSDPSASATVTAI
jgi:hypothetical protein